MDPIPGCREDNAPDFLLHTNTEDVLFVVMYTEFHTHMQNHREGLNRCRCAENSGERPAERCILEITASRTQSAAAGPRTQRDLTAFPPARKPHSPPAGQLAAYPKTFSTERASILEKGCSEVDLRKNIENSPPPWGTRRNVLANLLALPWSPGEGVSHEEPGSSCRADE